MNDNEAGAGFSMSKVLAPAAMFPMMVAPAPAGSRRTATGTPVLAPSNIADETDEALTKRVAAGDNRAFSEIVRRHGGRLRALALRFSGGAGEADDIVQETFVRFWRSAAKWQPGGPPLAAYLTRIAINRGIDGERRGKLRRFFGLEQAEDVADPDVDAEAKLSGKGELGTVTEMLKDLPPRQRAAILLAAEGERGNAEIAATLGLSVGAVEQLLVRARRTLRTRLAQLEPSGESEGR
jgi:RNA polymerase sigma-70 factor (ECF subfamily)